ncbi:hypothetical protein ABZ832_14735 [Streptantibioticus parmotrematis]|uniref:hypothetical protein n=1 Tax=Streptantibioticus parmotrematis TaxID=2873249 RepID=UPI0033EFE367
MATSFVARTMEALRGDTPEVPVEEARVHRENAGPEEHAFVDGLNTLMTASLAA